MPLNPEIAAIVSAIPPAPPLESLDIVAYRNQINAISAATPKLDVPLASITDRSIPGPAGTLGVRVYTPNGAGPHPLLVYFHGGGYVIGNLDITENICRAIASGASCVIMSVDYRLAPEHRFPAAPDDAWAALNWAFAHAGELNADPARIAVGGDSAGGNLSAAMALKARDARLPLTGQVLLYASPDYPDPNTESVREFADAPLLRASDSKFYWAKYLADPKDKDDPMASPMRAASHKDLAPAFIASAECDPSRDLGERYAEILRRAGTPVTAKRYRGMPHGFLNFLYVAAVREAMDELCAWLTQQWAKQPADRARREDA